MLKIKSNEMNKRRSSLPSTDLKQTGITQFVKKGTEEGSALKIYWRKKVIPNRCTNPRNQFKYRKCAKEKNKARGVKP